MSRLKVVVVTENTDLARASLQGSADEIEVLLFDALVGLYPALIRERPHALLVDSALPRLSIEATAGFLRSKGVRVPLIVWGAPSRDDSDDPAVLAQKIGAVDLVPISADQTALQRVLRRAVARAAPAPEDPFNEVSGEHEAASADILVIDDDPAITRLVRRVLEQRYSVRTANGGAAALALCARCRFGAVLCDLQMPEMSGADFYQALHARDPALAAHLVFMTAHGLDAAEAELFMGMKNHIIYKPFTMRDLLDAAAAALKDRERATG